MIKVLICIVCVLNFLLFSFASGVELPARGKAEYVVAVSWDGLRPDLVTKENTPNLFALSLKGVVFSNHHPVYPSSTEVNGTALATGAYPCHTGIIGNKEYRPSIKMDGPIATENSDAVRQADGLAGGHYLQVPTMAELLQAMGARTVIAGTKGVVLLSDRSDRASVPGGSVVIFAGQTLPSILASDLRKEQGPFPPTITFPNSAQDSWTTQALIEHEWREAMPKYSLLWLSDPDFSQHNTAPGEPTALAALKSSDGNLGKILTALKSKGIEDKTDLFIVSDHGFSTIEQSVDVMEVLKKAGFAASRRFMAKPAQGEVLVVGNGGSVFLYVVGHKRDVIAKLVMFLQQSDFAGVVLTRDAIAGTFSFAQAMIDTPSAPDIVVALQWNDHKNKYGVEGMIVGDVGRAVGQGMHASLSRYDMHNTLIAAGPDFQQGIIDELPTGNVDIAPTIAWALGVKSKNSFDGRILTEALNLPTPVIPKKQARRLHSSVAIEGKVWEQYLQVEQVGSTSYLIEGKGTLKSP